ncbi:MAG: PAS domain S-box protein [Candidatus Bathyarchaeota archaeon]|nr:PAS domain S-box protein [Candidatus Bathyarchaeota archaeon]
MNIYAIVSLCASAISIALGLSVYFLNRKATLNKLFLLTMAANAYWAFCQLMISQAHTVADAFLWTKVLSFWPFLVALMLHFTLVFTESDFSRHRLSYLAIYLPAVVFSLIDLTAGGITATPVLEPWGYSAPFQSSIVSAIGALWACTLGLLMVFLFINYHRNVLDKTRKKQTEFVALGFCIPIITSIVTDSFIALLGISFPVLGHIAGSATAFFVLYAMSKYSLFTFRSEFAAEHVFSTMPDAIILVNLKGTIIKINPSLTELCGYTEKEILGQSVSSMLYKATVRDKDNARPEIIAHLKIKREIKNREITFTTKAGERKSGMVSCSMVTDSNGQDVGASFVLHDITDHKEMEQKLLNTERLASIGELAGILGHDMRNPLSGIRGATYFLKKKYVNAHILDEEDEAMFESIDKSIVYANKIITDLVDYSSEIQLDLKTTTPRNLVRDALIYNEIPQDVTVENHTQDVPTLRVDESRICRGFANIIKNAFDAMPEGGTLEIASQQIGESVVFTFKDTGHGMTAETLSKLWGPLFTTKAKGMGFGLAICKRNVEAHNGTVRAESVPSLGTTIQIQLPIQPKDPQKAK